MVVLSVHYPGVIKSFLWINFILTDKNKFLFKKFQGAQKLTLNILCRKNEIVFPILKFFFKKGEIVNFNIKLLRIFLGKIHNDVVEPVFKQSVEDSHPDGFIIVSEKDFFYPVFKLFYFLQKHRPFIGQENFF